jgi:hypothetical protein
MPGTSFKRVNDAKVGITKKATNRQSDCIEGVGDKLVIKGVSRTD